MPFKVYLDTNAAKFRKELAQIPIRARKSVFRQALRASVRPVNRILKSLYRNKLNQSPYSTGIMTSGGVDDQGGRFDGGAKSIINFVVRQGTNKKNYFYAIGGVRVTGRFQGVERGTKRVVTRQHARIIHLLEFGFNNIKAGRRIPGNEFIAQAVLTTRSEQQRKFLEVFKRGLIRETNKAKQRMRT